MLCRNCGELVRRSRTQNAMESLIKNITPFRYYRCYVCGWRGMLASGRNKQPSNAKRMAILWTIAVILASGIGGFGAMQIR